MPPPPDDRPDAGNAGPLQAGDGGTPRTEASSVRALAGNARPFQPSGAGAPSTGAPLVRTLAGAAGAAGFGLLAATAVGAVVVAAARLLGAEELGEGSATDVLGYAVTMGLASLRVPLEAGEATGTSAPLTGAVAAVCAIAWATRRRPSVAAAPGRGVVAAGACLAGLCAAAAAATSGLPIHAQVLPAAVAGLTWGAGGAFLGARRPLRNAVSAPDAATSEPSAPSTVTSEPSAPDAATPEPSATDEGSGTTPSGGRVRRLFRSPLATLLVVAGGLAAAWYLASAIVFLATNDVGVRQAAGGAVMTLAFLPNVLAAIVALGCGAPFDVSVYDYGGGDFSPPQHLAVWSWIDGGAAPWYVLALVGVPLVATVAGALVPGATAWLRRGLRNGLVLGGTLFVAGWAGAYEATQPGPDGDLGVRFGVGLAPALLLGVAWGVAGSGIAALFRHSGRSRVGHR